ncbi:hypothetical protein [Actinacidiphila acididurans]|uniref:Lipoprotein n=1 Tax=Actinacidiphila acididurans TaxID=2784346 RepID=A0ABS2TSS3_9ACTN|nr:hypothetical protein [Actinacidiphila acididurans]MBM9506376.1 hypothetical protein [Actinacidiphila acididurans]
MGNRARRASALAALAVAGCTVLAGCVKEPTTAAGASATPTPAASTPAASTVTPSVTASATPSTGATGGETTPPAPPTASGTVDPGATSPAHPASPTHVTPASSIGGSGSGGNECRNLAVSAQVKAAVTRTWETAEHVSHVQPKPGSFYYGGCGSDQYAATRFQGAAGATGADLVALQDEGSVLQFFRYGPGIGWQFVTSDSFPASNNCSAVAPAALAAQWHCH